LTKLNRIISFHQKPWLKPWIDYCSERRKIALDEFESDLAKLQENATFGKTIQQVRHRVNVRLICDPNKLAKAVSAGLLFAVLRSSTTISRLFAEHASMRINQFP